MEKKLFALLFLLCTISLHAQQGKYFGGLLLDDSAYAQIPQKPVLLTRSYDILPPSHSLRQYCPATKEQGQYGTCTSWATTYAARTIAEAIANNWQDNRQITREAFAPLFIYALTKIPNDINCQQGIYLNLAFKTLKEKGAVKQRDFNYSCISSVPSELFFEAATYVIDDYFALFSIQDPPVRKVNTIKKSITEDRPVVISMACYNSFYNDNEDVWSGITDGQDGYHAMCVVAYDDDKYGGAFLLMNSWGTQWGDLGFKWVRYADLGKYVNYAMEMYVKKNNVNPGPNPNQLSQFPSTPPPKSNFIDLAGELHFVLSTDAEMLPDLFYTGNNIPYYKLRGSYGSGTRYRVHLSNHEPAYVYVIGSDLTNSVSKVFPPNNRISPALVYKSNDIVIPDEKWDIEMDDTRGTDYICVLYSHNELPIDDIVERIKIESGSFFDKVNNVLSDKIALEQTVNYSASTISFSVRNTDKTLVPVIVEIEHR